MTMNDDEVRLLFEALNMKTFRPPQAQEFFHLSVSPPQGGPVVDVIRLKDSSRFYIVAMGIQIAQEHFQKLSSMKSEERGEFLLGIQKDVLLSGVEIMMSPIGQQVPQIIQLSKAIFDSATNNEFLEGFVKVRNAGIFVMLSFSTKLGQVQSQGKGLHFM